MTFKVFPRTRLFLFDQYELIHQRELIPIVPGFHALPVPNRAPTHACDPHASFRRRESQGVASVNGREGEPRHRFLAHLQRVLDSDVNIRERRSELLEERLESFATIAVRAIFVEPVYRTVR